MIKKIILVIGALIIGYIIYYAVSPLFINIVADEALPTEVKDKEAGSDDSSVVNNEAAAEVETSSEVKTAEVVGTTGHPASGLAQIVEANGVSYLRYEDFKTINGPDLFVYLATDLDATKFVNLGELRATEGNVNYQIPEGTDLEKYRYALVWCKQFGVLFNSAELTSI